MSIISLTPRRGRRLLCGACQTSLRWYHRKSQTGYIYWRHQVATQLHLPYYTPKIACQIIITLHQQCLPNRPSKDALGGILESLGELPRGDWY